MHKGESPRDDRVLAFTKGLSVFIAPFLVVAFVILYFFPGDSGRLFAWPIKPSMTAMVLASAYLGGFYFFCRVPFERRWAAVKSGFPAVALFAALLGVATVLHWDKFSHGNVAFWIWAALYFVAPFLVLLAWLLNGRYRAPARDDEPTLPAAARWAMAVVGAAALVTGVAMFLAPAQVIPMWPWLLTPLTCRVVGAIFCLGGAVLGVLRDPRWINVRLMLQVELVMLVLMLAAAVRARDEFFTDRPLTWLMLVGFVVVTVGSVVALVSGERPGRGSTRRTAESTTPRSTIRAGQD